MKAPPTVRTRAGGVPGGHDVIVKEIGGKPFVSPMRECHSIELRHSDVVVDIGAYCGTYAIRCARFPVKRVVAYEPTPSTCEVLRRVSLPNFEVREIAVVGDSRESVSLNISSGIGVTNRIIDGAKQSRSVRVASIDYATAVRGASIVKIDVEGAEYAYPIVQPSIRALIIDFHPLPGNPRWIDEAEMRIAQIEAAGFRSVIRPKWTNGWTRAGSWMREIETSGECEAMMHGIVCCGCGVDLVKCDTHRDRTLCLSCWMEWSPKDRSGFALGRGQTLYAPQGGR